MKQFKMELIVCVWAVFGMMSPSFVLAEEPVRHLNVEEVTSAEVANDIFKRDTERLRQFSQFDAAELNDIHMITYSLETAVAFFVSNSSGDRLAHFRQMAHVVEKIHVVSENGRGAETKRQLAKYFEMTDK